MPVRLRRLSASQCYIYCSRPRTLMKTAKKRIMIIAGEASGDLHAAELVKALVERVPAETLEIFGSAGKEMRAAGVEATIRADDLSIVGLLEIGRALPMFLRAWKQLKSALLTRKPDVVVLVDFPDFNLKFARIARRSGSKVVYYISPQLWAWRQYRIRSIERDVDLLLSILPFEKDWYSNKGIDHVVYVGNPTSNHVKARLSREEFRNRNALTDGPLLALLPGSRSKEIERVLPVMLDAVEAIQSDHPDVQYAIASAGQKQGQQIAQIIDDRAHRTAAYKSPAVIEDQTYELLNAADAAAVTSGTATLETGILGTPLVVVYRTSAINYGLLEPLISVEHYGLVNLIAGERIATELIQERLTPENLAQELIRLLDPAVNTEIRNRLADLKGKLGTGNASDAAADAVIGLLGI
jgi:lipid-A-disaccharide synthase